MVKDKLGNVAWKISPLSSQAQAGMVWSEATFIALVPRRTSGVSPFIYFHSWTPPSGELHSPTSFPFISLCRELNISYIFPFITYIALCPLQLLADRFSSTRQFSLVRETLWIQAEWTVVAGRYCSNEYQLGAVQMLSWAPLRTNRTEYGKRPIYWIQAIDHSYERF